MGNLACTSLESIWTVAAESKSSDSLKLIWIFLFTRRSKSFRHNSITTVCNMYRNMHYGKDRYQMSGLWLIAKDFGLKKMNIFHLSRDMDVCIDYTEMFSAWKVLLSPSLEENHRKLKILSLKRFESSICKETWKIGQWEDILECVILSEVED